MRSIESVFLAAAASALLLVTGGEAHADIRDAFVNDHGDLEITFVDNGPPLRDIDYSASVRVEATYVCVNRAGRPSPQPRHRQTISAVLERTERFQVDFQGRVNDSITENQPDERVSLDCPGNSTTKLASVLYTRIELRSELGNSSFNRDVSRSFIALP